MFMNCTAGLRVKGKDVIGGSGGAIYVHTVFKFSATKCVFKGNRANEQGGSISAKRVSLSKFVDCLFTNSEAKQGGCISLTAEKTLFSNCFFMKCSTKKTEKV